VCVSDPPRGVVVLLMGRNYGTSRSTPEDLRDGACLVTGGCVAFALYTCLHGMSPLNLRGL
jgi:hypothetical protein